MVYKIMYPPIPNMGDLLNKDMLEELFNIKVVRKDLKSCNLIAIGSALDHIMYSTYPRIRAKQKIEHFMNDNVHIWSTGFIRGNTELDLGLMFRHIHIHALRGRLSLQRMENILGKNLMCRQVTEDFLPKGGLDFIPKKVSCRNYPALQGTGSPCCEKTS